MQIIRSCYPPYRRGKLNTYVSLLILFTLYLIHIFCYILRMKPHYFLPLLFLHIVCFQTKGLGQEIPPHPTDPDSHKQYITHLKSAEARSYEAIVKEYDEYLLSHPQDFNVYIEKCKFIGNSFYDEYEEYNPKQEEFEACLTELHKRFPTQPDVLLYKIDHIYGDTAIAFAQSLLKLRKKNPQAWKGKAIWKVYEKLATEYSRQEAHQKSIAYGLKAVKLNDALDLSLLLAQEYKALNKIEKARQVLISKLDSTSAGWKLNQKAELLLELGDSKTAVKAFTYAQKDSTAWTNTTSIARALEATQAFGEARRYFVKAVNTTPSSYDARQNLFTHDLQFQSADSAWNSYKHLRDLGYKTDPFGRHRLALFLFHPDLAWQWRDCLGIFALLFAFCIILILPYLWILPIQAFGNFFFRPNRLYQSPFRWSLKHFWFISSFYFLASFVVLLVYYHPELITYISDTYYLESEEKALDKVLANSTILFFAILGLGTFLQIRGKDLQGMIGSVWTKRKAIGIGILTALVLKLSLGFLIIAGKHIFPDLLHSTTGFPAFFHSFVSIEGDILAIKNYYNIYVAFFLVVIFVPVYEEIIFRGIILSSTEKYTRFFLGNILQSILFALIHQNLAYFMFYFAFGLLAGYLRNRSSGLTACMSMHATNNLLALLVLIRQG